MLLDTNRINVFTPVTAAGAGRNIVGTGSDGLRAPPPSAVPLPATLPLLLAGLALLGFTARRR